MNITKVGRLLAVRPVPLRLLAHFEASPANEDTDRWQTRTLEKYISFILTAYAC